MSAFGPGDPEADYWIVNPALLPCFDACQFRKLNTNKKDVFKFALCASIYIYEKCIQFLILQINERQFLQ